MSKRQQNFTNAEGRELDDDNDRSAENLKPALASQEVMAKRRVLKPKSFRNKADKSIGPGGVSLEPSGTNAFSLFGNSNNKLTSCAATNSELTNSAPTPAFSFGSSGANPFSKFAGSNNNNNNRTVSALAGTFGSKPANGSPSFAINNMKTPRAEADSNLFGLSKTNTSTIFNGKKEHVADNKNQIIASKLKALNENFMGKITLNFKNAPLADLSLYCKTYLKYIEKINGEEYNDIKNNSSAVESKKPTFSVTPEVVATTKSAKVNAKDAESSGDDNDSKTKIEIKGPSFQLDTSILSSKPVSMFRFGKKPKQKRPADDSDSDEDYSIPKGPSFSLSKISKKTNTNNTFSWGNKISADNGSKQPLNFGASNASDSKAEESKTSSTSSKFGVATTGTVKPPSLGFGTKTEDGKNDNKESKPFSFSVNSKDETEQKKEIAPLFGYSSNIVKPFSFGNSAAKSGDDKTSSTTFNFPASSNNTSTGAKTATFSFGVNVANSTQDKKNVEPSFKFAAANTAGAATPFSFAPSSADSNEKKVTQIPFKFGANEAESKNSNAEDKQSIFGSAAMPKTEGKNTVAESTSKFAFGANSSSTKPLFSFNDSTKKDEKKNALFEKNDSSNAKPPAFSFTSSNNLATTAKPAFSFGGSNSCTDQSGKALFSAGNTDSGSVKGIEGTKPGTANPFSFGKTAIPDTNTTFKFGSDSIISSGEGAKKTDTSIVSGNTDSENKEEKKTEAEEGATPPNPEDVVGKGEEDETVRFSARSKYLVLENGTYVTRGVGNLKVLTHKDTNKSRLLLRTEGNSNVCLNSYILKDAKYVLDGKINVRVPVINAESKKLEVNVVKVKDGKGLIAVIEKCQAEM